VATLRSTTIIITIRTTISIAMSAARDKVIGSTIRNTAEMLPMATGKRRISSGVRVLVAQAAPVVPAVRVALVAPVVPAVQVALVVSEDPAVQVALVVSEDPAVQVVQGAPVVPAVRVALVVPEDPVEPAVRESPVAPERELALAAVELEHGPVAVVLAPGHPRGQPAVAALRTKSGTAAHPHDLVPLLEAAEDLAAVAETTREPAAAEAVIAWEVAVTAVAEAVIAVVAAAEEAVVVAVADVAAAVADVAAAEEAGDKRVIDGDKL